MRHRIILTVLTLSVAGCGEDLEPGAAAGAEAPTEEVAAETDCLLPDGLLEQLNFHRQLVLNLASAGGRNRESVEGIGTPEAATFRSVADVLDRLDWAGVEPHSSFDEPDVLVRDLRQTADLLEVALTASGEAADPAWTALAEFYTQGFFVRHNASIGYYLDEADCT